MTKRHRQTRDELLKHLKEQRAFLRRSAGLYDTGEFSEAKQMALRLRVLLHDGRKNSKALLSQLGAKHKLRFLDTGDPLPEDKQEALGGGRFSMTRTLGSALTPIVDDGHGWRMVAPLGDHGLEAVRFLRFSEWWNQVVVSIPGKNRLSRSGIVLGVSNQDGGAHIDAVLNAGFAGVARQDSLMSGEDLLHIGLHDRPDGVGPPNPTLPIVRQIAFEVEETFDAQLDRYL